ncbi:MAG: microcin C ABC transporter permease YejB [Alphaproteobacteria bacterium]|nr:microcin C ABC transporter permease YejB [Alphaproteobacteria bacterium]
MKLYVLKRLLLIPLTLLLIMALNFALVQMAPGGPVERMMLRAANTESAMANRISGTTGETLQSDYQGAQGLDEQFIQELKKQFGFDKPPLQRFALMVRNYAVFDFGQSFYTNEPVTGLIISKLPVSIALGAGSTLLIYLIAIPLGIAKAVKNGSRFDRYSSLAVVTAYAVPSFLVAIFLITIFAGGSYLSWFPLRGLTSYGFDEMPLWGKVKDVLWHMALPVISLTMGGLASLTMLTKNSFLEEMNKAYVLTARAKGASQPRILLGHIFRNAMLIVIAGFPAVLVGMLFTGSVLIEVMFSLDGIGLLGFTAVTTRDYPVMFGTLYIFTLIGLVLNLVSDIIYHLVDPRIDFSEARR